MKALLIDGRLMRNGAAIWPLARGDYRLSASPSETLSPLTKHMRRCPFCLAGYTTDCLVAEALRGRGT